MKCEKCNTKEATFLYEETVNGKSRSYHLCADCAKALRESGELKLNFEEKSPFALFDSFSPFPNLLGGLFGLPQSAPHKASGKTCPTCGASWNDLAAHGKVFCSQCYKTFADELEGTLRSLHGNVSHTGRVPAAHRERHEKQNKLATLKKQLSEAVSAENFEEAARLRDEIRGMEA